MISKMPYFLFIAALISQQAACFQAQYYTAGVSSSSISRRQSSSATPTTSLRYANADIQESDKHESFRNSILNTYQREEPPVSISKLLTEQVAREFTTGRRYLLAASAVKELSEDFFDVEEQQRVRAVELMEYARSHDIPIMDYSAHVDKTPIDKSMETADLLQELLVQEQKDVQVLERLMIQVSSKNTELFKFLETIRADQMERKDQIIKALSENLSTLQTSAADMETATSIATAHVTSTSDFSTMMGENLMKKLESMEQLPATAAKWASNQFHHVQDVVTKSSLQFTGATAATVAAVDVVDPESLPSTEDIFESMNAMEDILQVVDNDTIQQMSQIVDIVAGLY